jgi:excisionase family DNA binding protein
VTREQLSESRLLGRMLLRVEDAARLVDISRSHAYCLISAGTWPTVRMGRSVRIPAAWLQRWVDEQLTVWEEARKGTDICRLP